MLIAWKLGLATATVVVALHSVHVAITAARDAHHLWNASRAKE